MNITEVTSLISTVGFPIVACVALFLLVRKEIAALTDAINNNTNIIARLESVIKMIDRRDNGET